MDKLKYFILPIAICLFFIVWFAVALNLFQFKLLGMIMQIVGVVLLVTNIRNKLNALSKQLMNAFDMDNPKLNELIKQMKKPLKDIGHEPLVTGSPNDGESEIAYINKHLIDLFELTGRSINDAKSQLADEIKASTMSNIYEYLGSLLIIVGIILTTFPEFFLR